MPKIVRDPFKSIASSSRIYYLLSQDWYPDKGKNIYHRINSLFNRNDSSDKKLLLNKLMTDKIPEQIPASNYTHIYGIQGKRWEIIGVRCNDCGKLLRDTKVRELHPSVCRRDLINKEKEPEHMPIQRVQKNGQTYYRWGMHGKLYKNRSDAEKQAQAAYASGYKEKNQPKS